MVFGTHDLLVEGDVVGRQAVGFGEGGGRRGVPVFGQAGDFGVEEEVRIRRAISTENVPYKK